MKMRSVFLFLIILAGELCCSLFASAQDFKGGIRFGGDGSQVNGDGLQGFDKAGILFGGFIKRDFSEKISAQMEMLFIQKGSRKPTDEYNQYYLLRVHYIEVPLSCIYHLNKKFGVFGGVSFGVLIHSEEGDQLGLYEDTPPFKKYEVAGHGGLLYTMSEHWNFDLRYSHSITTIRPYVAGYTTFFDKGQYNVLIEFSLMYQF
jgi:hypothetical protein